MATGEEKWQIEKLTRDNWLSWKFQMKYCLQARNLGGVVDGSEQCPVGGENERSDQKSYDLRKSKAAAMLVTSISPELFFLLQSCNDDPCEMWRALVSHFEKDSIRNKIFLKKQLVLMRMKKGSSVEEHIRKMQELTDKLA